MRHRVMMIISLLLGLIFSWPVYAVNSYTVAASATTSITEFGVCGQVVNGGTKSIMVPTKSSAEWLSFRTNPPPSVSVNFCCPTGYVPVPGDSEQGTSDFCVMQYEAKNVGGVPTSQANLAPWVNITQSTMQSLCTSLGTGYDLISNAQWQTVVRNAEYVNANWSGGSRGQGCFMIGNNDSTSDCTYDHGGLDYGTSRTTKARHILSNGTVVWDFGGNAAEYVKGNFTIASQSWYNLGIPALTGTNKINFGSKGSYTFGGCPGDNTHNTTCGVQGFAYLTTSTKIIRGGDHNDMESDAFFAHLGLGDGPYDVVGFRCAYTPP